MATTFLDLGLLKAVEIIFPFLLTWVVVYGLLEYRKVFGDKKGLHSIIAFIIAIFVVLSPSVTALIRTMAPWFLVILMLLLFSVLLFKVFGLPDSALENLISGKGGNEILIWWIIIITAIIFLASLGSVFLSEPLPGAQTNVVTDGSSGVGEVSTGAFFNTLFHPKILGMVFLMIIATFTIILLAGKPAG